MARTVTVVLERPNIRIRYRRFSFDIEGKKYDIVPDILPDVVPDIAYTNITCHLEHAGPSLQCHVISDSNGRQRQMDNDDLRNSGDVTSCWDAFYVSLILKLKKQV